MVSACPCPTLCSRRGEILSREPRPLTVPLKGGFSGLCHRTHQQLEALIAVLFVHKPPPWVPDTKHPGLPSARVLLGLRWPPQPGLPDRGVGGGALQGHSPRPPSLPCPHVVTPGGGGGSPPSLSLSVQISFSYRTPVILDQGAPESFVLTTHLVKALSPDMSIF